MIIDADFLQTTKICEGLTPEQVAKLFAICEPGGADKEEQIFPEAGQADRFYILAKGRVDLRYKLPGKPATKENTIAVIRPGHAFGWSGLVPPHLYKLGAFSDEDRTQFLCITRERAENLFAEDTGLGYIFMRNLTRVMSRRFYEMEDDLAKAHGLDLMSDW